MWLVITPLTGAYDIIVLCIYLHWNHFSAALHIVTDASKDVACELFTSVAIWSYMLLLVISFGILTWTHWWKCHSFWGTWCQKIPMWTCIASMRQLTMVLTMEHAIALASTGSVWICLRHRKKCKTSSLSDGLWKRNHLKQNKSSICS